LKFLRVLVPQFSTIFAVLFRLFILAATSSSNLIDDSRILIKTYKPSFMIASESEASIKLQILPTTSF
jgi:hypothetical protein